MPFCLYLLFNHELTPMQQKDAFLSLGISQIQRPPANLKAMWRQIPSGLDSMSDYLEPVKSWLSENARKGDYVLIQGDFGACFVMVNFAIERGLVPVYSTTTREAVEEHGEDGAIRITHRFKHVKFRKYEG